VTSEQDESLVRESFFEKEVHCALPRTRACVLEAKPSLSRPGHLPLHNEMAERFKMCLGLFPPSILTPVNFFDLGPLRIFEARLPSFAGYAPSDDLVKSLLPNSFYPLRTAGPKHERGAAPHQGFLGFCCLVSFPP